MKKEEAKLILEIQNIDLEIERVNKRFESIREEIQKIYENIENLKKEKEKLLKRKEELESLKRKLEEEIKTSEEKLKRTEEKLTKVTKDVEYRALLREKSKLEDRILKASYELDEVEKEINKILREIETTVPKIEKEIKNWEEELKDLEFEEKLAHKKVHELAQKRKEVEKTIPENLKRFYEENKKHFDGLVIVPVEEEACSGCGIKIPSVTLSKMMKEESIESCPTCGRFIYYKL